MVISKNEFEEKLSNMGIEQETLDECIELYEYYAGNKKIDKPKTRAMAILKKIFQVNFSSTATIPISFLETDIARVLFGIIYNVEEEILYSCTDIYKQFGITKQNVHNDRVSGKIKGIKKGGRWYYPQEEVVKYLESKKKILLKKGYNVEEMIEKLKS